MGEEAATTEPSTEDATAPAAAPAASALEPVVGIPERQAECVPSRPDPGSTKKIPEGTYCVCDPGPEGADVHVSSQGKHLKTGDAVVVGGPPDQAVNVTFNGQVVAFVQSPDEGQLGTFLDLPHEPAETTGTRSIEKHLVLVTRHQEYTPPSGPGVDKCDPAAKNVIRISFCYWGRGRRSRASQKDPMSGYAPRTFLTPISVTCMPKTRSSRRVLRLAIALAALAFVSSALAGADGQVVTQSLCSISGFSGQLDRPIEPMPPPASALAIGCEVLDPALGCGADSPLKLRVQFDGPPDSKARLALGNSEALQLELPRTVRREGDSLVVHRVSLRSVVFERELALRRC